jgi:hypothetical protein
MTEMRCFSSSLEIDPGTSTVLCAVIDRYLRVAHLFTVPWALGPARAGPCVFLCSRGTARDI